MPDVFDPAGSAFAISFTRLCTCMGMVWVWVWVECQDILHAAAARQRYTGH